VAIVHDDYQRVEPGPPYPSARLPHVCLGGHTMGAHALSVVSPMRYGRVSSNSATDEASKFAAPQKNLVCTSTQLKVCSFGPNQREP
jgi:hypothetical protein